jgi:hypothetical protein
MMTTSGPKTLAATKQFIVVRERVHQVANVLGSEFLSLFTASSLDLISANSRTEFNEALAATKLLSAWILVPSTKPALTHWATTRLKDCNEDLLAPALANDLPQGFVKILADPRTDKLLGAQIIGAGASELIPETVTIMEFGGSAKDLGRTVHAHPTMSEAVKEAALAVE